MSDDQTKSTVSARVPTGQKEDLLEIAHQRSSADDRVTISDLVGEAVENFLEKHPVEEEKRKNAATDGGSETWCVDGNYRTEESEA